MLKIQNFGEKAEIKIWGNIIDDTDAQFLKMEAGDDIIGFDFPSNIKEQLEGLKGIPVDVHIASDGGSVSAGIAIFNMLKNHDADVEVYIDSWAASIASLIAFAGNKIHMAENTFMMIHNPAGGAFGDASYLRSVADWLDKLKDMIADTYTEFAKISRDEIVKLMDAETWMNAAMAKEVFGDKIELMEGKEIEAVAQFKSSFKNAPSAVAKAVVETEEIEAEDNADKTANNGSVDIKSIINVLGRSAGYEEESRNAAEN